LKEFKFGFHLFIWDICGTIRKHMKIFQLAIVAAGLSLFSCTENTNTGAEEKDTKTESAPSGVKNPVSVAYLAMKDAFYKGDAAGAKTYAEEMDKQLGQYSPKDTSGWKSFASAMQAELKSISASTDIAQQRVHFQKVSDAMFDNAGKYQFADKTMYRQHCPMAFDGKGAYWLSDRTEIENPYYGSAMPDCGVVEDTLEVR
jgi:Cu(I)/Ag(I) efflux system membrane fusion protein